MSAMNMTAHGLKYTLSDSVAAQLETSSQLSKIKGKLSDVIEAQAVFPSFAFVVTFIALFISGMIWWKCVLFSAVALVVARILAFSSSLMMFAPITFILCFYERLTILLLPYIGLVVTGIILKPWYAGVVADIVLVILSLIVMQINTYQLREPFYNKVAAKLLKRMR